MMESDWSVRLDTVKQQWHLNILFVAPNSSMIMYQNIYSAALHNNKNVHLSSQRCKSQLTFRSTSSLI